MLTAWVITTKVAKLNKEDVVIINALTAWVITTKVAKLNKEDVVIINAAGSAIGKIFAQLAPPLFCNAICYFNGPFWCTNNC